MGFSIFPKAIKRIGKSLRGKPALLLVVLPTHEMRQTIVNNAKHLRKSLDEYTRNNVFIDYT